MIEPAGDGTLAVSLAPTERPQMAARSAGLVAFGGVIGASAFLLFSVEPLIGRLVLPVFGGASAVWATTLFFFQAVLLIGYLYAHLSVTRLGLGRGAVVHVGLVAAAAVALALAPARAADLRNPGLPDVVNLVVMLAVTIGLPAFVLTTTTPLMSAWYAARRASSAGRAGGADGGRDAYWLYALSNSGSLLALLAYPFLIEPRLGLSGQRSLWLVAFVLWGVAIAACAIWASRWFPRQASMRGTNAGARRVAPTAPSGSRIMGRRRATWLLLAAVPSGLLSAVTTFIATDLVSAPLLWLAPLAIYLASFIVAFSERGRRTVPRAVLLAPAAITLMWVPYGSQGGWPIVPLVVVMYGGLAIVATALHGRLAMDRPDTSALTEFYLVIAIGGALASAFVALLAPLAFAGVWELPILLVLGLIALGLSEGSTNRAPAAAGPVTTLARFDLSPFVRGAGGRFLPYLAVAAGLAVFLVRDASVGAEAGIRWLLVGGLLLLVGAQPVFLAVSTGFVLALAVLVLQPAPLFRDRSFFGVTEVQRPAGATRTVLVNGTTIHGIQSTEPGQAGIPLAYYATAGPFGDVFRSLKAEGGARKVAAVGLGAGAVATYLEPGWSMTFFEIDPLVVEVASDPRYFTYLSDAAERPAIVLGDARLSLRGVASGSFDAILVDAFSSDSIPTHLLTVEAVAEYARVVRPGGIILVHTSNRYYDLVPAVAAAAEANGMLALQRAYVPTPEAASAGASVTAALAMSSSLAARSGLAGVGWQPVAATVGPMTDDFMDVLRFLRPIW